MSAANKVVDNDVAPPLGCLFQQVDGRLLVIALALFAEVAVGEPHGLGVLPLSGCHVSGQCDGVDQPPDEEQPASLPARPVFVEHETVCPVVV